MQATVAMTSRTRQPSRRALEIAATAKAEKPSAQAAKPKKSSSKAKATKKTAPRANRANAGEGAKLDQEGLYCICLGHDDETPMIGEYLHFLIIWIGN
jgi:hypothetical protein